MTFPATAVGYSTSTVAPRAGREVTGGRRNAAADPARGYDHGVWSVLRVMYPDADGPVLPLGIDMTLSPAAHYRLVPFR